MDAWLEAGLSASLWLQTSYPELLGLLQLVSDLGDFEFYLALMLFIYWTIDKRQGQHLAYTLAVGNFLINGLKHTLRGPRPFWLDASLGIEEEGYGVPSGHVTSATVTYLYLANWIRQRWAWVAAVFIIALMALSRIYLGVHFLHDALAGLALGTAVFVGYLLWRQYAHPQFQELILGQRFWVAVGVPIALGFLYALVRLFQGGADTAVSWGAYVPAAELDGLESTISALAILLGLGMGFILEGSRVRFVVEAELWHKIVRYLLGVGVALGLLFGLSALFGQIAPETSPLWVQMVLRFVRYWLVAIWGAFYAPMFFVKIGLAQATPMPKMSGSVNKLAKTEKGKK